jgi:hypothetical protein
LLHWHIRLAVQAFALPPSLALQFNDPPAGMSEQMILNQHLYRLLRHSRLSAFQQFVQQSLDGFFVKVGAQKACCDTQ